MRQELQASGEQQLRIIDDFARLHSQLAAKDKELHSATVAVAQLRGELGKSGQRDARNLDELTCFQVEVQPKMPHELGAVQADLARLRTELAEVRGVRARRS